MIFEDTAFLNELLEKRNIYGFDDYIKEPGRVKKSIQNPKSALMVSAHQIKHMNRLDCLKADIAMINLEDGVSSELKPFALKLAAVFLSHIKTSDSMLVVRINPLGEGGEEEIGLLNRVKPDAIRVPKIKNAEDVQKALTLIDDDIDVHLSIETKEAFLNLEKLKIDKRVTFFYLGILDLLSSLDIPQGILKIENPTIDYILTRFLVVSKAVGAYPVSFVYQDYKNLEEFEEWCRYEREMGYSAKGCISPSQVEIANRIFKIYDNDIEKAIYIVRRFEEMRKKGITGFVDENYGFIDEPIYKDALNIIKKGKFSTKL
ncbi:HpcH/HpaI aldolase/citrate lyase family protein [Nitrosophilus alvini]|uniref:HpcH/HpaI aldolase/citrate lyase family protein n=1 Tax=Nitrosophilus alvini TaxID=2714855 RepID=UPI00190DB5E0|nr:aldolase/citrate lyase family protein [Nitrosophilus alvini]